MAEFRQDDLSLAVAPAKPITPEEPRAAQLTVCERCPDDAALLLDMLGLL